MTQWGTVWDPGRVNVDDLEAAAACFFSVGGGRVKSHLGREIGGRKRYSGYASRKGKGRTEASKGSMSQRRGGG